MVRAQKRPAKRSARPLVLRAKVEVEVSEAPFHTFDSLRHLDVARLSRAGRARFEVGWFETDCCRKIVHAIVRKGMVTELEDEPCSEPVRITPELERLIRKAAKQLGAGPTSSSPFPMPVRDFIESANRVTIQVKGCIKICVFERCVWCCFTNTPRWWARCGTGRQRPDV